MMDGSPMAMAMTSNELYESGRLLSPETLSLFGSKLIEQDRLQLQEQVGQGNFGTVHRGLLSSSNGSTSTEVAIKIPRISAKQTSSLKDFYLEAQIATTFDHENILSCLGISANPNEAPWLVFEYMPFGDLAEVLRSNSGVPSLQRQDLPILEMVAELLPQCKIHLTPPESCPDLLKSIMLSCLELEAQDRIRFPEIIEKLEVRQFFCHTNPSYVETKFTPHPTAAEPFSHNDLEFGETRE
eukprot:TCALIF_03205-PA protein Name:"Similar to Ror Tyrosine-protein kinase transmembrane receptor Ror (Drosophila melanogaster)" AED:0.30 eAED:0.30 QI:503/0.6/0.5/0.66/0.6/0.5/6/0/240